MQRTIRFKLRQKSFIEPHCKATVSKCLNIIPHYYKKCKYFFTKKKLVDELNRKYNSNIQLDDNPINVRDALIYGYGRLIGINIYDRYVDDKKDILKRFDNFMNQYTLVGTFDSIDVLGISKDDLISNKVLKRTLKEYKIKYDDYIVRNRK